MIDVLISQQYQKQNYKVVDCGMCKDTCIVFFSSNGLYRKDDENDFCHTVIEKDRYEWENIKNRILQIKKIDRFIFLRDVYKHSYVEGISNEINSIDEILELLKGLTKEYRHIITVGNSSGGYMAIIAGVLLHADKIISFGSVISLYQWGGSNDDYSFNDCQHLTRHLKDERSKYYDVRSIIGEKCTVPIFHFYAADNTPDVRQVGLMQDYVNLGFYPFGFIENVHGKTMYPFNMAETIICDTKKMIKLYNAIGKKRVSKFRYSVKLIGVKQSCIEIILRYYNAFLRRMGKSK